MKGENLTKTKKNAQVKKYFRDTQKQLKMLTQQALSCRRREVDLGTYLVHYKANILL